MFKTDKTSLDYTLPYTKKKGCTKSCVFDLNSSLFNTAIRSAMKFTEVKRTQPFMGLSCFNI